MRQHCIGLLAGFFAVVVVVVVVGVVVNLSV